jgi:hypothetical protein
MGFWFVVFGCLTESGHLLPVCATWYLFDVLNRREQNQTATLPNDKLQTTNHKPQTLLSCAFLSTMKKGAPFILLMTLALLVFVIRRCQNVRSEHRTTRTESRAGAENRKRGFDRTLARIEYTEHARCRMKCRKISQEDVEDIIRSGNINYHKSDVNDRPCPTYAVQGYTRDREHLRVIFGQCEGRTKVITCYNLEEEFECHCPGDKE